MPDPALALGLKGGGGDSPAEEAGPDEKEMAAEGLIDALKGGDASAVASAFQRMSDACSGGAYEA